MIRGERHKKLVRCAVP